MSAASASRRAAITKQSRNRGHDRPRQVSRVEVARLQAGASSGTSASSLLSPVRVTRAKLTMRCKSPTSSALVSGAGNAREAHDALQVPDELAAGHPPSFQVALQVIVAHVVGPAFQQRRGHGYIERRAHRRKVAMVELILERLGARR